jgi:hypothetical protein
VAELKSHYYQLAGQNHVFSDRSMSAAGKSRHSIWITSVANDPEPTCGQVVELQLKEAHSSSRPLANDNGLLTFDSQLLDDRPPFLGRGAR